MFEILLIINTFEILLIINTYSQIIDWLIDWYWLTLKRSTFPFSCAHHAFTCALTSALFALTVHNELIVRSPCAYSAFTERSPCVHPSFSVRFFVQSVFIRFHSGLHYERKGHSNSQENEKRTRTLSWKKTYITH